MGLLTAGAFNNPPEFTLAAGWFAKASAQGHAGAMYNLGVLHLEGKGVEKNAVAAAKLIGAAAEKGNPDAMLDYGVLVFRGEGVQQSEKIGAQWLLLSAKRGNIIAQNRVARLYAFGKGFPANAVEAMKWNILASRGGRGDAELDTLLSSLSDAQKAEAEKQADAFKPVEVK
jgi:TPR repeat protein